MREPVPFQRASDERLVDQRLVFRGDLEGAACSGSINRQKASASPARARGSRPGAVDGSIGSPVITIWELIPGEVEKVQTIGGQME